MSAMQFQVAFMLSCLDSVCKMRNFFFSSSLASRLADINNLLLSLTLIVAHPKSEQNESKRLEIVLGQTHGWLLKCLTIKSVISFYFLCVIIILLLSQNVCDP